MQFDQEPDADSLSYIADILIDTGRFVFDVAIALAEGVLGMIGFADASPEALIGIILLAAVLSRIF